MFLVYACFMAFTFPLDGLFNVRAFWHVLSTACFAALFCDLPTFPPSQCVTALFISTEMSRTKVRHLWERGLVSPKCLLQVS